MRLCKTAITTKLLLLLQKLRLRYFDCLVTCARRSKRHSIHLCLVPIRKPQRAVILQDTTPTKYLSMKRSEPESSINKAYLPTQELWLATEPLLPVEKPKPKGGRPRGDAQQLFNAMFYVLRTGIQWKALPSQLGAASTAHDRYQERVKAGVFEELWHLGLMQNQVEGQLDWEWQSIDSASSKAPLGGESVGANPTDRGKGGTKRHIITEAMAYPLP